MAKRAFIGVGHGGNDPGAVYGGLTEKAIVLSIALAVKAELIRHGVEVMLSRYSDENDPVHEEVNECNSFRPDIAADLHINAGGGDGCEVFYHYGGGVSKQIADNINSELVAIGQNSRGCKIRKGANGRDYYMFIRETNAPSVIVESAFIDSADIFIVDEPHEQIEFGKAIARGMLKTLGIAIKGDSAPPSTGGSGNSGSYVVRIDATDLNIRKGPGTNYGTNGQTGRGSFTIVDEANGPGASKWGKLKSGAGWISLDYTRRG